MSSRLPFKSLDIGKNYFFSKNFWNFSKIIFLTVFLYCSPWSTVQIRFVSKLSRGEKNVCLDTYTYSCFCFEWVINKSLKVRRACTAGSFDPFLLYKGSQIFLCHTKIFYAFLQICTYTFILVRFLHQIWWLYSMILQFYFAFASFIISLSSFSFVCWPFEYLLCELPIVPSAHFSSRCLCFYYWLTRSLYIL